MLVGVASGSGPSQPVVKSAKAPRTDQHAFPRTLSFWKCSNAAEIARRDMIVGYGYCNTGELRRLNPKGVLLLTPGLFPTNGDEYGGMFVTYGGGLWYWRKEGCDTQPGPVNLGCIRAFSFDWDYMWNADGSYAVINAGPSGHRGWNLADPAGKGTRELVAKFIAYTAKLGGIYTRGWDGVFSDNWIYGVIGKNWAYGPNLDTDRDRKVDDYATLRRRWDDGLNEVGNRVRSYLPGKTVAGNASWYPMWYGYHGSDPEGWLKASNATMVEDISSFYNKPAELLRIASRWLTFPDPAGLPRYVLFQLDALTSSGDKLRIPTDADANSREYMLDSGVMRSMRWGLTLSMMAGAYYEIIVDDRHETRWWYDEYDGGKGIRRRGYLGQPLGPPVRIRAGGVWRRDFDRGIALNNSSSKAVTINLKSAYRQLRGTQDPRLNGGRTVTNVTLPPHDGLILLNVKPTPNPKR